VSYLTYFELVRSVNWWVTPPDRSSSEDWTGCYYGCGGRRWLSLLVGWQSSGDSY